MLREDKIKLAIQKGYTYDELSGKIFSRFNREIKNIMDGYITIGLRSGKKIYLLRAHQFIFYIKYGKIVEEIDHKDGDRSNNKIDNLREVTHQQNQQNKTTAKGYTKCGNMWQSQIKLNNKSIYLGRYNTEKEARQAYLDAKKIYHNINVIEM